MVRGFSCCRTKKDIGFLILHTRPDGGVELVTWVCLTPFLGGCAACFVDVRYGRFRVSERKNHCSARCTHFTTRSHTRVYTTLINHNREYFTRVLNWHELTSRFCVRVHLPAIWPRALLGPSIEWSCGCRRL
jgi:hypothetical protein